MLISRETTNDLLQLASSRRGRDDLFRVAGKSQDVQSAAGAVRTVDQAAVVNLYVVGDAGALALAGRGLGAELAAFSGFGVRACRNRKFIRRRNEVGDLMNGKRIANIPDAHARVEPREYRELA